MTKRTTAFTLLLLDIFAAIVVFNLIAYARGIIVPDRFLLGALFVPVAVFVVAVHLVQGYRQRTDMLSVDYASQHLIATFGAWVITVLITFVVFPDGFEIRSSRAVITLSFVALVPLTLTYRRLLYLRSIAAQGSRSIVFVGDRPNCAAFDAECRAMKISQPIIFSDAADDPVNSPGGEFVVRRFGEVLDDIHHGRVMVEAIVLRESARELSPDASQRLVELYFTGVPTYTLELFHEIYWQKIPLYRLNQTWLFQEGFKIAREPVFERLKRVSDLVLAGLGLVLALPWVLLAAVAIWLEDRQSPLFTQTRIGRNHVPFRLFKLRTMKADAGGNRYTQPGDSRITRVGRFLRSTRLDEVPQLLNVLKGDMSLIGPRAEWDQLVEGYEREIPCYEFRHLVKPGITGWAQVNYPYGSGIGDTLRKLEYDLYYIRHFSFRLDATIVLKTIHTMLFGRGQ